MLLNDGERVIRRGSACLSVGFHTSWRPASLVVTNRRLLFCQPPSRAIFEASLDDVTDLAVVKRRFILGLRRKQLYISFRTRRQYVAVNNPEEWMEAIMQAKWHAKAR